MGNNTIQLNGKLYDAVTGKPLKTSAGSSSKPTASTKAGNASKRSRLRSVDGVSQNKTSSKAPAAKAQPKARPVAKPATQRGGIAAHIKPQRTKTLRRSVLTKPTKNKLSATSTPIQKPAPTKPVPTPRAATVGRSPLISKFNSFSSQPNPRSAASKPKPKSQDQIKTAQPTAKKSTPTTKSSLSAKDRLIAKKMAELNKQTAAKPKKQRSKKRRGWRIGAIVAGALIVLVVGLYIIYLNIPNVAIKYASYRAGFDASLPHYVPSGFSYHGPVEYQPGQVTVGYRSNSDNRHYSISEQPTDWDSEAVYDNFVAKKSNQPPYTFQDSGLTIYVFGKSSAAWVNGGKFYAIDGGNSELSPEQLQNIATSL